MVNELEACISGYKPLQEWELENTSVSFREDGGFQAYIHKNLLVETKKEGDRFTEITVTCGGFYDYDGNPSRVARERINGILDMLGAMNIIPDGVRVYYSKDDLVCYITLDEEKTVLNQHHCTAVTLAADAHEFRIIKRQSP